MIAYPIRILMVSTFAAAVSASTCFAPAAHASGPSTSPAAPKLNAQTSRNLDQSMRGEAFANASYTLFADEAQGKGLSSTAGLFRRTAQVELGEHFTEESALSGLVGGNAANLKAASTGEEYEATTMYPTFARQAKADGDANAATLFSEIAKDEANHRDAFLTALKAVQTGKGAIPAAPSVSPVAVQAGLPKVHSARTRANLDTVMHGEALAHAKYSLFAKQAARTGNAALARLFNATADVELREHFTGEAALAGTVRETRTNLGKAIAGELYESRTMYPAFARQAAPVGDTAAAELFRNNAMDEARHARAFQAARNRLH
ncbi:rubrerythrin family protein [Streptomyces silvisoli]|uniref:Rubrerythrin family protein n=1 Tax=Streptomyces silvisoli TaxID=3034235 RepID=A0ABT5ZNY7_9ACTN|nr:rubrerythrin family protein [Streptomyces silvisoli]MDF3291539.1 rubrerythrin family protein [Streptomyces silvisoli]